MIYLFCFISLVLGLVFQKQMMVSLICFSLLLVYCFIKKINKFYLAIIFYIIGIVLFFLPYINIFSSNIYGIVIESKDNYFIFKSGFASYYVSSSSSTYEVGDLLLIKGDLEEFNFTTYESQFNFNLYLNNKYVYRQISNATISTIFQSPFRIRSFIYANLSNYSEDCQAILGKLLYNVSLSDEYSQIINDNSLFYILSVSSLHLHLLNKITKKIGMMKFKEKTMDTWIIGINILLFLLSNYKISILKVLLFEIIHYLNEYRFKRKLTYIESISLIGIVILLLVPYYSLSTGFFYSFSIPFYIFICRNGLSTFKKRNQKYGFILFIFLFFIPLSIYQNGYFSLFSMALSQILVPLVFPMFALGLIGLFFPLYKLTNAYGLLLYNLIKFINNLGVNIYIGEVNIFFVIIYYLLLILFLFFIENKQKKHQLCTLSILFIYLLINALPIQNQITCEVDFINVGQGDSCLIRNKNTTILVDTGGVKNKDIACDTLIPFFKKNRISYLDYVFITHSDYDHCGAFDTLKENFKVIDYNQTNDFTSIQIGAITFSNLNPSSSNEENDNSLVLYFTMCNKSFLLMGDASSAIERQIINQYDALDVDYIKIGHHGSKYSTCDDFISFISPKEAIVSVGANNYYGHPTDRVLNTLENNHVKIRRTDKEGTIRYKFYSI